MRRHPPHRAPAPGRRPLGGARIGLVNPRLGSRERAGWPGGRAATPPSGHPGVFSGLEGPALLRITVPAMEADDLLVRRLVWLSSSSIPQAGPVCTARRAGTAPRTRGPDRGTCL